MHKECHRLPPRHHGTTATPDQLPQGSMALCPCLHIFLSAIAVALGTKAAAVAPSYAPRTRDYQAFATAEPIPSAWLVQALPGQTRLLPGYDGIIAFCTPEPSTARLLCSFADALLIDLVAVLRSSCAASLPARAFRPLHAKQQPSCPQLVSVKTMAAAEDNSTYVIKFAKNRSAHLM